MKRMDSYADKLTTIGDDIAVTTGRAETAHNTAVPMRKDMEYLMEQVVIMEQQIQRLQTDVRMLKGDP